MPELPEVETVVRDLSKHLHGLKIVSGKVLCSQICKNPKPLDLDMLRGSRIKGVRRRGKMILVGLERNITILFHLGMTGQLFFSSPHDPRMNFAFGIFGSLGVLSSYEQMKFLLTKDSSV
jgi:formamidopyrimidine-DNA glycosylase